MIVATALHRLGGVSSREALVRASSRREVDRALREGTVVRDARGRYALPGLDEAVREASRLTAVLSVRSAAAWWGWAQKSPPAQPEVTVRRDRRLTRAQRRSVRVHFTNLPPHDVHRDVVTTRRRTLVDCLRLLTFDEALAIADSALRAGGLDHDGLVAIASQLRGAGAGAARRVAQQADERAANPFESVLRAIALDVPGLRVVPQQTIHLPDRSFRPDLVDVRRRLVLEADSFAWHGSRQALRADTLRYNALVLHGWTVLRFSWEDVMLRPSYVAACLGSAVELQTRSRPG